MATSDTLLQVVSSFCRRRGIPVPTSVVASTDETYLQMWELLNEEVEQLIGRGTMSFFRFTNALISFSSGSVAFSSFNPPMAYPIYNTLFKVSTKLPVPGPLSPQDWQSMITMNVAPAAYAYTIKQSTLMVWPIPTGTVLTPGGIDYFSMEYYTDAPCINPNPGGIINSPLLPGPTYVPNTTTTFGGSFTSDASYSLIPTKILKAGLTWRWLKVKGLPYAEDMASYERMLMIEDARDGSVGEVHADNENLGQVARPGLLIPAGNWNVS